MYVSILYIHIDQPDLVTKELECKWQNLELLEALAAISGMWDNI